MQLYYCCLPLNFRKFFRTGILKNTCKRLYLFQSTFTCLKTNTAQRCEICAKQTMKTPEWRQWPRSGVYLLLTLNIIHISFWRFYYWLQVLMCLLDYKERNFKYYTLPLKFKLEISCHSRLFYKKKNFFRHIPGWQYKFSIVTI